jgi:hypothetical protein
MTLLNSDLVPVIQTAIGPVIMISGVGMLLLSMTNRLARTIDRARELSDGLSKEKPAEGQLAVLWARARTQRLAILCASASALCFALLIIFLFLTVLMNWQLAWLIAGLFILGMILLIDSIFLFIRDVNQTLEALKLELRQPD